ncbi:DMT family transporter [Ottowia sp. GY511]|uniref:DMT family transporter n=1 Tax=Ottowia flava TaxID=2675430 RepID=A0ABW4KRA6_9BURK|nr:DMT family transporter [Ottowia sp. GY511]TXK31033.1 DMT family transporter [Ottowia sp. GY511]
MTRPLTAGTTLPALALLFNAMVWGLTWIAFKALHDHGLHPLWSTAIVYGGALTVLLVTRPSGLRGVGQHPHLLMLALAAGLTNVSFNWAVTIGDVVRVVLLFYMMPVWSTGLAWWLLDERPTAAAVVRMGLALMGVVLVLYKPGALGAAPTGLADALALLGGFSFALTNTLLRRWRGTPKSARATAMFIGGVGLSAVLAWALAVEPVPWAHWTAWLPWAAALVAAFLCVNLALQYGAARLPAQTTSLIMLSEVVFATVSAVMLGATHPSASTWLGGALIMAAALLAVVRQRVG